MYMIPLWRKRKQIRVITPDELSTNALIVWENWFKETESAGQMPGHFFSYGCLRRSRKKTEAALQARRTYSYLCLTADLEKEVLRRQLMEEE